MRNKKDASIAAAQLLQRAEEKLEVTSPVVHPPATEPDALRLVLELQVYQIELELQNEELQRARDETGAWLNLYTGLYDFAPVGYFTLDRSGCIRRANLAGAQLLGVDRDRLVNLAFDLYVSRDTRDVFASFFAGVGDGHSKQTCEVVLQTEENYPINVRIDAGIYGDKEECQIAVVDITERKQAEQTQREIGDRAQQYLDIAGVMLVGIARDQTITLINKQGCALLGYSQEELLGKNWFDVGIPEHDRQRVKTAFAWMMRGNFEMVEYFENTVVTRSGEERLIKWHNVLLRDATGKITGTLSSGEDITVRKQAEEALQTERDNLAAIFASSPVGMLLIDEESMIVNANSVIAGMVSRNPAEIIRQRGGGALGCIHSFQNEKGCGFSPECLECPLRLGITQVLAGGTSIHGVEIQPTLLIGGREHVPW
ncbi:MAG: PAS domain-containing protein, partial [Armatimonadota bacterium]